MKRNKYITAPLENWMEAERFLGTKRIQEVANSITVEDNLTNRILLDLAMPETGLPTLSPVNTEGLFGYQVEDVTRMMQTPRFLNANKMGTGKTIETIVALRELNVQKILVIAPKPTLHQWANKFAEWWPARAEHIQIRPDTVDVNGIIITNYEHACLDRIKTQLLKNEWGAFVLDEAHVVKNRDANRTAVFKSIKATRKYALTGTPILKTPEDLWSILQFLDGRYACNGFWNFVYYYCHVNQLPFGRVISGLTRDASHVETLNKLLQKIACRRDSKGIAKGKLVEQVPLEMSDKQKKIYKSFKNLVLKELPPGVTIPNGAVKLNRCIQATTCPSVYTDDPGIKFLWVLNLLENSPEDKIVVFSKYTTVLTAFGEFLDKNKIGYVSYTGKQTMREREDNKTDFATNPQTRVMMGTIAALGVGVDGLQDSSHIAVFLDRDWSPAMNEQCEDRLHRVGQEHMVNVYYLECLDSVDRGITKVNLTRSDSIRLALDGIVEEVE